MKNAQFRSAVTRAIQYAVVFIGCWMAMFPLLWILRMSLMPAQDTFAIPPVWTFVPTLESFRTVLGGGAQGADTVKSIQNSFIVASGSTILVVVLGTFGAYATALFRFRGRGLLIGGILATRMLPPVAMIVPLFLYAFNLGLLDTHFGLIMAYTALNLPFSFWMLHGFIGTIPPELHDQALVDGCSRLKALGKVILPLVGPGLVAAGAFAFIFAWNDFAIASVLSTSNAKTLPMMILSFKSPEGIEWGSMAATATIAMVPPLVFVGVAQKWMLAGLTMGATKS